MVRLISRQRGGLAALKLTKLFGIDDFPAAKDSGKVLIIIIYCYLIIIALSTRLIFCPSLSFLMLQPCERLTVLTKPVSTLIGVGNEGWYHGVV